MITQIIIERVNAGWAWDLYNETEDTPMVSGTETTLMDALAEVEQQIFWGVEGK